ncbi:hypothetical protein IH981_01910 [Patescibacteria group bacterium]|nr:hypothetical protein [Patescibacteria group bacterium]
MGNKQLIFIYNAGSDFFSQAKDLTDKITKGKTQCSLCNATWDVFNKKASWSEKEKRLKIPYKYLHKDELSEDIVDYLRANDKSLPTVLLQENNSFRELVNKYQLDKCAGNVTCVWNILRSEKSLDLEN